MKLETVQDNLKRTIAAKEHLLDSHKRYLQGQGRTGAETIASETIVKFLEINIAELNRILDDVVECSITGIEQSWRDNPDRSGGQFTQEEIDNAGRWQ